MSGYKKGGYREKYIIQKVNGNPIDPEAFYFVLRLDKDPHALSALKKYADSVCNDNESLHGELQIIYNCLNDGLTKTETLKCLEKWRNIGGEK